MLKNIYIKSLKVTLQIESLLLIKNKYMYSLDSV